VKKTPDDTPVRTLKESKKDCHNVSFRR